MDGKEKTSSGKLIEHRPIRRRRRRSQAQFPGKLHDMMTYIEQENLDSIYRSFQRQLNMWRFVRVAEGPEKGAFVHPYFVRGNKALCRHMTRNDLESPTQISSNSNCLPSPVSLKNTCTHNKQHQVISDNKVAKSERKEIEVEISSISPQDSLHKHLHETNRHDHFQKTFCDNMEIDYQVDSDDEDDGDDDDIAEWKSLDGRLFQLLDQIEAGMGGASSSTYMNKDTSWETDKTTIEWTADALKLMKYQKESQEQKTRIPPMNAFRIAKSNQLIEEKIQTLLEPISSDCINSIFS